ncbi:MAG: hypothetical protein KC413_01510, partial [Anaerolineales bacterium]|nr:hypothetical protein [Anaerolineales bacterium]
RAMTPWPGAYTTWKGVQLKILEAEPVLRDLPAGHPGEVVQRTTPNGQTSVLVLTVSGGLALQTVQLAGKRAIAVQDFVRGQPDFIGSKLGE